MKKLLFVAVLGLGFAACGGSNSAATTDSTKVDSAAAAVQTVDTTQKVDSTKALDTTAKKVDSTAKAVTK